MTYGVRQYGVRQYGDGNRVVTDASPYGGGGGGVVNLAGTSALVLGESAILSKSLRGTSTLIMGESAALQARVLLSGSEPIVFTAYGRLTIETAVVSPPSGALYVKRVSPTMPTPSLDSRGRPT